MDFQSLANAVHGLTKKVVCDDDPYYYYTGRITIDDWVAANDGSGTTVTLGYTLQPFKTCVYSLSDKQRWDPFCFKTDFFMTNSGDGAYSRVEVDANKYVDFLIPCVDGHTEPHSNYISQMPASSYVSKNHTRLFGGMVQTPFSVHVVPLETLTTSDPGTLWIRFRNMNLNAQYTEHTYTVTNSVGKEYTEPEFILSDRDFDNRIIVTIKASFNSRISIVAYTRSL